MYIGYHFGPNRIYGVELSAFRIDELDFEQGSWEIVSLKLQFKLFGLRVNAFSLDVSDTRTSLGILNCYLSVFWG